MRLIAEAQEMSHGITFPLWRQPAPPTVFGTGAAATRRSGSGDEFLSYRHYQTGDDTRQIDWRRSGRSDDVLLREQARKLPHEAYLYCDTSPAMQYNSRGDYPTKAYCALRLAAALHILLLGAEARIRSLIQPWHTTRHLADFITQLEASGAEGDVPPALPLRMHSHVIYIADFRQGHDAWRNHWQSMAIHSHGTVLQILDPAEIDLPFYGRVRLESAEGHDSLIIPSVDQARPHYQARLAHAQDALHKTLQQLQWGFHIIRTDTPARMQLQQALGAFAS